MTENATERRERLQTRRRAALVLTTVIYCIVGFLAVRAFSSGVAPLFMLVVLVTLVVLEMLLVLAFLGSPHALWAGITVQTGAALTVTLTTGPMTWTRAIVFAAAVALLTSDWLMALKTTTDRS